MSTKHYFEAIGAWPSNATHMERMYVIGFVGSLVLTLVAYSLATQHVVSPHMIVFSILVLASLQFILQVVAFLHVSSEPHSRERLVLLGCAMGVMLILVLGSMWIMSNLSSRMTPQPEQMETYMQNQQGI